jgi:hypothetical protein
VRNFILIFVLILLVVVGGCGQVVKPQIPNNPPATSLASIVVSPESVSLIVGTTQQFCATGIQACDTVSISPSWEVIGDIGTINSVGLFTATKEGVGTIEARVEGVVGRAQVEVTPRGISGYVYDYSLSNPYSTDRVPISGANIYLGNNLVATADSNGYFTVSNVPVGELVLTAIKDGYYPLIIATNKNRIDFCLSSRTYYVLPAGSSTIKGDVIGLPDHISSANSRAYSYENNRTSAGSYDNSTKRYNIPQSPDNGETYISIDYSTTESSLCNSYFTYTKLNMSSGTTEVDLAFGGNSIDCNILVPTGYKTVWAAVHICKGNRIIPGSSSNKSLNGQTSVTMSKLPNLQTSDSFAVSIQAGPDSGPSGAQILKFVYNVSGSVNVDLSSMHKVDLKDPTPAEESTVISGPTIAWEPFSSTNPAYYIYLSEYVTSRRVFDAYTRSTTITIPDIFKFEAGKTYYFYVTAMSMPGFDIEDLFSMFNSTWDQLTMSTSRKFIGGYTGPSSLGVRAMGRGSAAVRSMPEEILGLKLFR